MKLVDGIGICFQFFSTFLCVFFNFKESLKNFISYYLIIIAWIPEKKRVKSPKLSWDVSVWGARMSICYEIRNRNSDSFCVTNTVWHASWAQIGNNACNFEYAKAIFGFEFMVQFSHTKLIELEIGVFWFHTVRGRNKKINWLINSSLCAPVSPIYFLHIVCKFLFHLFVLFLVFLRVSV